jgi:hypothetical protein
MRVASGRHHRWLVGLGLSTAVAVGAARAAAAPDRMAVLMVADDDGLADNLAEVAISHLAKSGGFELVGARELRGRLPETQSSQSLRACLARPACRTAVGTAASAGRAVIGDIRREGESFRMDFSLADLRTGEVGARFAETIAASDVGLIAATRAGLDELFASPAPTRAAATAPPAAPVASRSTLAVAGTDGPTAARPPVPVDLSGDVATASGRRASMLPYLGAGAGAAAVVSFSAAAVTGYLATSPLAPGTRADMQVDLGRHDGYATTANILLGTGTVFAAISVVSFYRWWRGERIATRGGSAGALTSPGSP